MSREPAGGDPRLRGFNPVFDVMRHIRASGVEWPRLRFDLEGMPFHIRLNRDGERVALVGGTGSEAPYYGHIGPDGVLVPSFTLRTLARPQKLKVWLLLSAMREDPIAAVAAAGRAVGWCCVCGRPLSDPESVAAGIGPVCAGRLR